MVSVLVVAALLRVWSLGSAPLIITNDGYWYLHWAQESLKSGSMHLPPYRTPGYPLFLASVFGVWGMGPTGVLLAQQGLSLLTALMITWAGCRLGGARWGLVAGLLAAIDPLQMAMAHYLLTETLATALLALAAGILLATDCRWPRLVLLGLTIAGVVLVRPSFQCLAPAFALALVFTGSSMRQRFMRPVIFAAVFLAAMAPWVLRVHHKYGSWRVAESTTAQLWHGVCKAGLLKTDYPLPPEMQSAFDRMVAPHPNEGAYMDFFVQARGWDPKVARIMTDWAIQSIRERPREYARAAAYACLWQLDLFPPTGPTVVNDTQYLVRRLTQYIERKDGLGPNMQISEPDPGTEPLTMRQRIGPGTWLYRVWAGMEYPGLVRLPLFACACAAIVLGALRGKWAIVVVFAGTIGFGLAHALALQWASRYSLPCWAVWPLALPVLKRLWEERRTRGAWMRATDAGAVSERASTLTLAGYGSASADFVEVRVRDSKCTPA